MVHGAHIQSTPGGGGSQLPLPSQFPAPTKHTPTRPHHLPREVVKDIAAMGVEDGNGLSKVVPL